MCFAQKTSLGVERSEPSRITGLEQRIALMQQEKIDLESSLSTSQAKAETALKAARLENQGREGGGS